MDLRTALSEVPTGYFTNCLSEPRRLFWLPRVSQTMKILSTLMVCTGIALAQSPTIGKCPVFPSDNIWNTRIDQLAVHPSSSTWVNTIGAGTGMHADFGSGLWDGGPIGIPFVTVPGTQTKYPATFTYQSESDPGPYAIPLNAPIEGGSASTGDRHTIAIDTDNCILYELYAAYPQAASWQAGSGVIFNLQSDALRTASFTSADAAGLPIFPGLVRYDEIVAGAINHAIRFTVPKTQNTYVWPARHEASSLTGTQYPPMGARFRLKASFNISTFSATNQIILRAMQQYGMMIADNGSSWYISGVPDSRWNNDDLHVLGTITGSNFEAVDVSPLMVDPNSGQARQTSVFVTVTPSTATVNINKTQPFSAVVTGNSNQSVRWDVNGTVGGNGTVGFIDSISGLYTAPATVPSPATVTIHATSMAVSQAVGSATVTVTNPPAPTPVSVTISPTSTSVRTGHTVSFTAKVKNTTNTAVTWRVTASPGPGGGGAIGSINSSGVYTAPATVPPSGKVTVTAVSVADPTKSASATVTITKAGH